MNEDYKELVEFLDGKFDRIDGKFAEIDKFSEESLRGQDEIITKLDTLLQEKIVGDEQNIRQKKVLEIHNSALKSNKILSEQQSTEIDGLRVF